MSKPKEIDILDMLPPEAIEAVDNLGYEFLAGYGYDTEGARDSKEKQKALRKALKENGETLTYAGAIDPDTQKIKVWYFLHKGKELVSTSRAIECVPIKTEEDSDGENRTDQEGPAPSA